MTKKKRTDNEERKINTDNRINYKEEKRLNTT